MVVGWELRWRGRKGEEAAFSPCCASALGLLNNGWKGDGEMGSVGGTIGHAPIACVPDPGRLPPAGTSLGLQSHPWTHGHSPTASCPTTAHCPMALCSPKDMPDLPSQSLCFLSLEASGSEARVSKVGNQFLPLQIAPVLFCFLTLLTQPWKLGCCHWGSPQVLWWLSLATRATPISMSPLRALQNLHMDGCGSQVPFPGSCLHPGLSKCKLAKHKSASLVKTPVPEGGWTTQQ